MSTFEYEDEWYDLLTKNLKGESTPEEDKRLKELENLKNNETIHSRTKLS